MIWVILACHRPPDPRPDILSHFLKGTAAAHAPETALREERPGEACLAFKQRLLEKQEESDWAGLLTASARCACISNEEGDALSTWAASREPSLWAGPRAEWLAFRGDVDGAKALFPSASPDARMRVSMRIGDGQALMEAAESVLVEAPGNLMACRQLVNQSLDRANLFRAAEEADCNGVGSPDLSRVKGIALDQAGEFEAAEKVFRDTRSYVHLASILYQESPTPERIAEARTLLAGDNMPPSRMHQGWMYLLGQGEAPPLAELSGSPDLKLVAAALQMDKLPQTDLEALQNSPGAASLLLQARIAAARGLKGLALSALEEARRREPYFEPVLRGAVGVLIQLKEDPTPWLDQWKTLDPDHVRLRGIRDRREVVWVVVVPWSWEQIAKPGVPGSAPLPTGHDEVGDAWRTAVAAVDRNTSLDILEDIQQKNPELRELASIRYRLEAGLIANLSSLSSSAGSATIPHSLPAAP